MDSHLQPLHLEYTDITEALVLKYQQVWKKKNPDAHKNISPSPSSNELIQIATMMVKVAKGIKEPTSIIHQLLTGSDNIICPRCKRDINDLYTLESEYIDDNLCPICQCQCIQDHIKLQEKCHLCQDMKCELWEDYLEQCAYEAYVDDMVQRNKELELDEE